MTVRTVLPVLLLCLAAASGKIFAGDSITVHIAIEEFRNDDGVCRLLLYNSEKGFPDSREYAELMLGGNIQGKKVIFSFKVRPGKYAISILHDENSNEEMDKTWYGKPKEGFGASNNPKIGFGPPEFNESAVKLDEKSDSLKIKMNYF